MFTGEASEERRVLSKTEHPRLLQGLQQSAFTQVGADLWLGNALA